MRTFGIIAALLVVGPPTARAASTEEIVAPTDVQGVWEGVTPGYVFMLDLRKLDAPFLTYIAVQDDKRPQPYLLGPLNVDAAHALSARGIKIIDGKTAFETVKVAGNGIASKNNGRLDLRITFDLEGGPHREIEVTLFREGYFKRLVAVSGVSRTHLAGEVTRYAKDLAKIRWQLADKSKSPVPPK
jgi:hypothetical protein